MSKSREDLLSPLKNQEKIIPPKLTISDAAESGEDLAARANNKPERSFTGTFDGTFEFDKSAFKQERILTPGTIIGGTYEIKSLLGSGGMGQVYLARHQGLDRDVALKVLASNYISERAWRRFEAEAKAIAGLDHPSLVRVNDLGVHEGKFPYYAMEYIDGESLESVISKLGPMIWQRALPLFKQVADGLAFAHNKGIVHRDLKPANILVLGAESASPQIKILDFGLAKLSQMDPENMRLTTTGEIFGSPYYMSPEQCLGNAVDARSDIYSLGCTLFECLTGKPPYTGEHALAVLSKHQIAEIPSLSTYLPRDSYPHALNGLITRMLAKEPGMRYQSMNALAYDIACLINGDHSPSPLSDTIKRKILSNTFSQKKVSNKAAEISGWLALSVVLICYAPVIQNILNPSSIVSNTDRLWTVPPPMVATPEALYGRINAAWRGYLEVSGKGDYGQTSYRLKECQRITAECQEQLIRMGAPAVETSIRQLLAPALPLPVVRDVAQRVLEQNGADSIAPIFTALAQPLDTNTMGYLTQPLRNQSPLVRQVMLGMLASRGSEHERVINVMYNMVKDGGRSANDFRTIFNEPLQEKLAGDLEHQQKDPEMRRKLVSILTWSNTADDYVVDIVGNLLAHDRDVQVRLACARFFEPGHKMLSIAGTNSANQFMRSAMRYDPSPLVRAQAAAYFRGVVLQQLDTIIKDLRDAGEDSDPEVALAARKALCFQALTNNDCMVDLHSALDSGNTQLTYYALEIANRMKRAAVPVVPALQKLSTSSDLELAGSAKRLLDEIGPFYTKNGAEKIKAMLNGSVTNVNERLAVLQGLRAMKRMTPEQAHQFMPEVKKLMKSDDEIVRQLAVQIKDRFQYPDD